MSGDDKVDRAIRALRASGDAAPREGIRARVLLAAARRGRTRRRMVRWVIPLAATFVFSSAWAGSRGYLGRPLRAIRDAFGAQHETSVANRAPRNAAATASASPMVRVQVAQSAMPAPAPPLVTIDDLPRAPPQEGAPRADGSARASSAPSTNVVTGTASTEADALYAAAHRAHFVDRDPVAALAAWDAYLRVAPNGPLAPEAQYNRGLALVRLGRRSEASAALRPFVEGRYGSYRQREAEQIAAALDRDP